MFILLQDSLHRRWLRDEKWAAEPTRLQPLWGLGRVKQVQPHQCKEAAFMISIYDHHNGATKAHPYK